MSNKPIIVFEGIEGSGKTTHLKNIASYLKKRNVKYVSLREPGGSKNSELIRKIILNKKSDLHIFSDLLLYLAARNENINKIIKKNYKKKIILIDRFIDSTIAYQHYGMGINFNLINSINKYLIKDINIDCIFLNTVSTKKLKIRLKKRRNLNKYDRFKLSFYKKVQKGFLKLSKNKKNYTIIDSNKDINVNKKIILNKIDKLIFN
tara:strand:- start:1277 stop:1894 length:618 start_codon:yes stop_codon:yes gene_type:complete